MQRFSWGLITMLLVGLLVGCGVSTAPGGQGTVSADGPPDGARLVATPSATPVPTNAPDAIPTAGARPASDATLAPSKTATSLPTAASVATSAMGATPAATSNLTAMPDLQDTTPLDSSDADELVSRGLEIYQQQYCGICHKLSAADTGGTFGPTHDSMRVIAEQRLSAPGYKGAATTAGEYIYESLIDPKAYLVPGYEVISHHMPAYTHLEQGDLEALVQMLLQQR